MNDEIVDALMQFYRINAGLMQKMSAVLDRSGRRWSEVQQQTLVAAISDTGSELEELLGATDAPAFMSVQARIVQRHWEARQQCIQEALASVSRDNQLTDEVMTAMKDWQRSVIDLMTHANSLSHVTVPWMTYLGRLERSVKESGVYAGRQTSSDETRA
jgi:hypothetical protein